MEPFNWVDIDGIRYSWNGQGSISCFGRFAYQTQLDGSSLTGLEIENEDGEVAGVLNVDFAAMSLSFVPYVGVEPPHLVLLFGDGLGQQESSLQSLTALPHDLLASADPLDWSSWGESGAAIEVASPSEGHILSWDSFHFDEETSLPELAGAPEQASPMAPAVNEISISLDMSNQVLDMLPPYHDV
ncbi:hypothetical protein [Aeromonas bivalvium]|uniref:hypothetical protein n=1 Tax=Aeromonas bivalvium TaxID=440079 RepID=UPI0005A91249|nr:hypothetical protein [Aeromonas bivalvium]